jgi:hypothetical protein
MGGDKAATIQRVALGWKWNGPERPAIERLGREVDALERQIRRQTVPENARMAQRYR